MLLQEESQLPKEDKEITQLTKAFENLKIHHVMKNLENELEEIKAMVNELNKTVSEVTRKLKAKKEPEARKCFTCQEVGYISRHCPRKKQERTESTKGKDTEQTIKKTDVRFFEFVNNQERQIVRKVAKEKESDVEDCLKIEINSGHEAFNVRALGKRRYAEKVDVGEGNWKDLDKVIKGAVNENQIEVNEILSMTDEDLDDKDHGGRIMYWNSTKERDNGTIQTMDLAVIMRLTEEN
ncbi:40472_t:CDS:2 [Gigaspora margarita]|uniref:40472_t:CDS:1 n=1 Tax=Gigaspora margarita TaxID=4874 RepID=A0ABN7UH99_GIGMA|nr:40472_t:CDS:2 [Gigaspora margarita]